MENHESEILAAWQLNGKSWIAVLESGAIQSREASTNAAICRAILELEPANLLDIGCGEGWLCRAMAKEGLKCHGIDGVETLVDRARAAGASEYTVSSYQDLIAGPPILAERFDAIVFNFSLFGESLTAKVLAKACEYLAPKGHILVQTVHPQHPAYARQGTSYWTTEHWNDIGQECTPFDWYFRSHSDWQILFEQCDLNLIATHSTRLPQSDGPFSIIYVLQF